MMINYIIDRMNIIIEAIIDKIINLFLKPSNEYFVIESL